MIEVSEKLQLKKAYSIKSAAFQFDASVPFVRNEIRDGRLRAKRIGGKKVVILDSDLQQYLDSQPDWTPKNEENKGEI